MPTIRIWQCSFLPCRCSVIAELLGDKPAGIGSRAVLAPVRRLPKLLSHIPGTFTRVENQISTVKYRPRNGNPGRKFRESPPIIPAGSTCWTPPSIHVFGVCHTHCAPRDTLGLTHNFLPLFFSQATGDPWQSPSPCSKNRRKPPSNRRRWESGHSESMARSEPCHCGLNRRLPSCSYRVALYSV